MVHSGNMRYLITLQRACRFTFGGYEFTKIVNHKRCCTWRMPKPWPTPKFHPGNPYSSSGDMRIYENLMPGLPDKLWSEPRCTFEGQLQHKECIRQACRVMVSCGGWGTSMDDLWTTFLTVKMYLDVIIGARDRQKQAQMMRRTSQSNHESSTTPKGHDVIGCGNIRWRVGRWRSGSRLDSRKRGQASSPTVSWVNSANLRAYQYWLWGVDVEGCEFGCISLGSEGKSPSWKPWKPSEIMVSRWFP